MQQKNLVNKKELQTVSLEDKNTTGKGAPTTKNRPNGFGTWLETQDIYQHEGISRSTGRWQPTGVQSPTTYNM